MGDCIPPTESDPVTHTHNIFLEILGVGSLVYLDRLQAQWCGLGWHSHVIGCKYRIYKVKFLRKTPIR